MADCFITRRGGGGGGLNFEVVGNPKPTNPKENTIWINTDAEITSWVFSAGQPESPTEGLVWIELSVTSDVELNALKKNAIQIGLVNASQYVSGAWVEKTAFIYQAGEWVDVLNRVYLFKDGDECTSLTGGWSESSDQFGTATITDGLMTFTGSTKLLSTVKKLSKGTATKLCVNVKTFSLTGEADGNVVLTGTKHQFGENIRGDVVFTSAGLKTIDLSKITSTFYVEVYTYGSSQMTIDKIWME